MKKIFLILTVLFLVFFIAQTNLPAQMPSPRPTATAKPTPAAGTAQVFIDGLSILYHSSAATEIGFVKDYHNAIEIAIYKQDGCQAYPLDRPRPGEKLHIEIYKTEGSKSESVFYESIGGNDVEDFHHMPDMCSAKWYPGIAVPVKSPQTGLPKEHLSGKLIMNDAVFYTKMKSVNNVIRTNLSTGDKPPREVVGKVLGADITCLTRDCKVIVNITGNMGTSTRQELPSTDGPYFIFVRTHSDIHTDHLHLLYDYIIDLPSTLSRYDFKYEDEETRWVPPCTKRKYTYVKRKGKRIRIYKDRATEYACQTFGSCGGTLPNLIN